MCHIIFEVNEKTYQSIVFDVIDMKHGFEVSQLHAHINMYMKTTSVSLCSSQKTIEWLQKTF